jgi:WD40 repeat protein
MDVAFSPDSRILVAASFDRTIRQWDAGTGGGEVVWRVPDQPVWCFIPAGRTVVE